MFHSLWNEWDKPQAAVSCHDSQQIVDLFHQMLPPSPPKDWPLVPVTAWTADSLMAREFIGRFVTIHKFPNGSGEFFWGRVPSMNSCVTLRGSTVFRPDDEFVDLGTPLRFAAGTQGRSATIQSQLRNTDPISPSVWIGVVDQGKSMAGSTPDDFNGMLRQLVSNDIEIARHAESVLAVILERLDSQQALADVGMMCALVTSPPPCAVGPACFNHDNVVDLQQALVSLDTAMQNTSVPWCVNMSMGTHVGPHNGESPLEEFVDQMTAPGSTRHFFTSAGNDGQRGIAAFRRLKKDVPDDLVLRTGSAGAREILVEFWWREPPAGTMSIEVMVRNATGRKMYPHPLQIDSHSASATMSSPPAYQFGTVAPSTLFHANCRNGMSCAAFAITSQSPGTS